MEQISWLALGVEGVLLILLAIALHKIRKATKRIRKMEEDIRQLQEMESAIQQIRDSQEEVRKEAWERNEGQEMPGEACRFNSQQKAETPEQSLGVEEKPENAEQLLDAVLKEVFL